MNHPRVQCTAGNQAERQVTPVTLVSEEDCLSGQDVTTAPSSSVAAIPQPKREWHIKTICVTVCLVTLVLTGSILVPVLSLSFLGEVRT